jgi:hypothetical protein
MPDRAGLPHVVVLFALVLAACGSAPANVPSELTGPPPIATTATTSRIDHPTGATDVVLQMEDVGGQLDPIYFTAGPAPTFTLYGDGRVVFQQLLDESAPADEMGFALTVPWRTGQLDTAEVEELLMFALGPGGLATARESYQVGELDLCCDVVDTIFTVNAAGLKKTVTVSALSLDPFDAPDGPAWARFQKLAARLRDFDAHGTLPSDPYVPQAYRGVMLPHFTDDRQPIAWPWPAIVPADFKPGADAGSLAEILPHRTLSPTEFAAFDLEMRPHRTLSPAEVAALGLGDLSGGTGIRGVLLKGPDGKGYSLVIRPLLPSETE